MKCVGKDAQPFTPAKILLVFLVCQALFLSFIPFLSFSAQTSGYHEEPSLYHTYEEMVSEIQDIGLNHSAIVVIHNLTTTYEGNAVWAVKISDEPEINDTTEPHVLFIGGQKANSFISVEMALYLLDYLTTNYGEDSRVTELVDNREIWIIPMLNPDGHAYIGNETEDWVKNRRDNSDYYGVNLDRNYGFNWSLGEYSSDVTSSPYYHGETPFSEHETNAIKELVENQSFEISLSFSSYGETITYPWGHTNSSTPDSELLFEIASDMAMYSGYNVEQSGNIRSTHGNLDDWLYNNGSGVLPFTVLAGTEDIPDEGKIDLISQENLLSCLYLIDIADNPNRALRAEWSFMVYMSGDNDLEGDGIRDFNEMETVGSSPYLNIVVQFDRTPGEDSTNGDWKDTRRFLVTKDDDLDLINSPMVENIGEANMGNPQTLLDFVNWSIANYPAERYFLDIWGHGKGWQGVSRDDDPSGWLSMSGIRSVLPDFSERIDVVGFDNCNMAMIEVYTQFLGYADYIVGSEKEEDAWGWPYDRIFGDLLTEPQTSPVNLSKQIAKHYVEWAQEPDGSSYSATVSVADMNFLSELINKTDDFARELNKTLALYSKEISAAKEEAEKYDRKPFPRDFYHFAELVKANVSNRPVQIASQNVMDSIEKLIVAEEHFTRPTKLSVENAHGIAIWLYDGIADFSTYQNLEFAQLTFWDEFLLALNNPPPRPHVNLTVDYSLFDSDFDGNEDEIEIHYTTNVSGLNIITDVYNNENEHVISFYHNNTLAGSEYDISFNPRDYEYPPDLYNFYIYIVNNASVPQNYSEVAGIWLGNEKPDALVINITFFRMDGARVGGDTGKNPIDGEDTDIIAYVTNNGTNDLHNLKIEFFEGDNPIKTESIDILEVGVEKSVFAHWIARAGERDMSIVIDGENEVKEINESNNEIVELLDVKPNIPVSPLTIKGKILNKDKINIIGAKVKIKNLRTNETINKTTNEKGYSVELEPNWYLEGDLIEVKASYSSASDSITVYAYSDDKEIKVDLTLNTDVYDFLFFFKLGLIGFEIIGFILVVKYYFGMKRVKGGL